MPNLKTLCSVSESDSQYVYYVARIAIHTSDGFESGGVGYAAGCVGGVNSGQNSVLSSSNNTHEA